MKYYLIDRNGKIRSGNADTWNEVKAKLRDGETLYNPHTKKRVIGWNKYKAEIFAAEKPKKEPSAPPQFSDKFPFWARLKIGKNRSALVIDEEEAEDKKTKKMTDMFVHREATHTASSKYEEIFPNPDKDDPDPMYLRDPEKKPKKLFKPHNKNLDMPEHLQKRYSKERIKKDETKKQ